MHLVAKYLVVCATEYELECKKDTAEIAMFNCLPDLVIDYYVWYSSARQAEPRTLRLLGVPHHRTCLVRLL